MDVEKKKFLLFPRINRFAVIRMNPVAMIQELELDGLALSRAQAMLPRKYLVYLDIVSQHRSLCMHSINTLSSAVAASFSRQPVVQIQCGTCSDGVTPRGPCTRPRLRHGHAYLSKPSICQRSCPNYTGIALSLRQLLLLD